MPRKEYQFRREPTEGRDVELSLSTLYAGRDIESVPEHLSEELVIHPYTKMIPLSYIMIDKGYSAGFTRAADAVRRWGVRGKPDQKKINKLNLEWRNKMFITMTFPRFNNDKEESRKTAYTTLSEYIEKDNLESIGALAQGYYSTRGRDHIIRQFFENRANRFFQRTYKGFIEPYTMYVNNSDNRYHPIFLAVVLPENYLYVKYHILAKNTIPLDRVVVLVDKDIDKRGIYIEPVRKMYRELMPHVMASACQVWKVPKEFIIDSCFHSPYTIKSVGIKEIKEEKEQLINEFYETFGERNDEELAEIGSRVVGQGILEQISTLTEAVYTVSSDQFRWEIPRPTSTTIQTGREGHEMFTQTSSGEPYILTNP